MDELNTIITLSTIMWLLVDWLKPLWEKVSFAKYITMAVALVGSVAMTLTFGLDLLIAVGVAEKGTAIGGVFAALAMTAGSGLINEIVKAISGAKSGNTTTK